jgi:hypothetical protein
MKFRTAAFASVITIVCLATVPTVGQGQAKLPRTPDGQPDLQGTWSKATVTPLERPPYLAGKEFFTEAEAVEWEKGWQQRIAKIIPVDAQINGEIVNSDVWTELGKVVPSRRTSLIVDPPDGRIPYTAEGKRRADAVPTLFNQKLANGPEDRPLNERCILWGEGPPMEPVPYNSGVQVFQSRDHIVILSEMIHNSRVIPLDGRPHLTSNIRQWSGDSRGHWEGDTLVVDTRNFTDKARFQGSTAGLHVIERFTRVDEDTIRYEFTVEDPAAFTRPWRAEFALTKMVDGRIFEYACHEGNYSIGGVLAGARAQEKEAAK